jgi:hypothetical protein
VAGDFFERIDKLLECVGDGNLVGSVEYDQAYAKIQHEVLDFDHPQGGEAKFLANAVQANHRSYLDDIADRTLRDGPQRAMEDAVEDLVLESSRRAPIGPPQGAGGEQGEEIARLHPGLLRASGHGRVVDDGEVVYDRPGAPREG